MFSERFRDDQIYHHNGPRGKKLKRLLIKEKVKAYLKLFLENSSIHGLNHLIATRRQFLEIFLWLTVIAFSTYGSVYLSRLTWARYQSSPTVISIERDMFAWNTTFPCITICPDSVAFIDRLKLENYLNNSKEENKTRLENFILGLANATYKSFEYVPEYSGIPPDQYVELILNLSQKFEPSLTIGVDHTKLSAMPTITEMGLCFAVNSEIAVYNSPKYRTDNKWNTLSGDIKSLKIHPLDGEVFAQMIEMPTSYSVYLHGPEEMPDITSKFLYSDNNFYLKMYVTVLTVYTTQRAARFPQENNLKHNTIYTYTMCRMECRIRFSLKYCQCIPHFYRRIAGEKICDYSGFQCLSKYKDKLYTLKNKDGKRLECNCFPLCNDVYYVVASNTLSRWELGTNLQWGMVAYPRMRYKRDIIFGFTDLLVSVGGMAGLFLGCSVLSFIEIIYYLTLRLFCYNYKRRAFKIVAEKNN